MRPMYEIVEMIRAHYANDDDKFNNYAKAIIDYYEKEGNLAGADEIREIIKQDIQLQELLNLS